MLRFLFYLFMFYIVYSWIKLIFGNSQKANSKENKTSNSSGSFFSNKRKKMEDELSEYVDYEEIK